MHIHKVPLALAMITSAALQGQTLDISNFTPILGTNYINYYTDYQTPGLSGSGQVWDLSQLSANDNMLSYFNASSTNYPASAYYAGSTTVHDQNTAQLFYSYSDSGVYFHGTSVPDYDLRMIYQTPLLMVPFPCSFNNTWTNTYGGHWMGNTLDSIHSTGTNILTADGSGTLIMPYGTVQNVLRLKSVSTQVDDHLGLGSSNSQVVTYMYYKPGFSEPLIQMSNYVQSGYDGAYQDSVLWWLDGATIGVQEAVAQAIGLDILPNPTKGPASLVFSSTGAVMSLAVVDATGRTVHRASLKPQALGIGTYPLDLTGLPAGLYTVYLTSADGQRGSRRLVIE